MGLLNQAQSLILRKPAGSEAQPAACGIGSVMDKEGIEVFTRRVLFVDPDELARFVAQRLLRRNGKSVLSCKTGQEALSLLDRYYVDVVLCDLTLEDMTPGQFIARARQRRPGLVVIVTSADADLVQVHEALASGADDFLAKPFDSKRFPEQMGEAVRDVMAKRRTLEFAPIARLGDLVCPQCDHFAWRSRGRLHEYYHLQVICGHCGMEAEAERCKRCGEWGLVGVTYSAAFGICRECAERAAANGKADRYFQ